MALEIFGRDGDSTGGVKEEKELWLACQSTGPHGSAWFLILDSLMLSLVLSLRHRSPDGT